MVYFPVSANRLVVDDTLKKNPDTTDLHVIRTGSWLIQAGYEYRYVSLDFKNVKMNLDEDLNLRSSESNFGKRIYDWSYKPVLAQNYAFVSVETKYGRFSYSKDIGQSGGSQQTRLQSYALDIPYKKLTAGFSYVKMTGFNRKDPFTDSTTFLKNFTYNPFSVYLNYSFGKLKNPFLYQPRKRQGAASIDIGYNQIIVSNSGDFIPALRFNGQGKNLENVEEVNNVFTDRFVSKGGFVGFNFGMVLPVVKPTAVNNFHCIYFQLKGTTSYSFQSYNFHIISDSLNNSFSKNVQYSLFRKSSGATTSYIFSGELVFDFNKVLVSAKAVYQQFNYGLGNGTGTTDTNLHMSNTRFNVFAMLSYRFNAKKINDKVDGLMSKFGI